MAKTLPRTGTDQFVYWQKRGAPHFCYVIKAKGDSPIKVGKALDVLDRLGQLQTGNPRPLELVQILVGYSGLEWQLHHKLRRCRMTGEWFDGEPIRKFVAFVEDLSEQMVLHTEATDKLPDWRDFGDWVAREERHHETLVQPGDQSEILAKHYGDLSAPEHSIKRPNPEIGWRDSCPECDEKFGEIGDYPDPKKPSWWPGILHCRYGTHSWTYSHHKRGSKKMPELFYLIEKA